MSAKRFRSVNDNYTVHVNENAPKFFKINIKNSGKYDIRVKSIASDVKSLCVVNFDDSNMEIVSGDQASYLFKAEFQPIVGQIQASIHVVFHDESYLIYKINIVYDKTESVQVVQPKKRQKYDSNSENSTQESDTKSNKKDGISEIPRKKRMPLIEISDDLQIIFGICDRKKSCEIAIKNLTAKPMILKRVSVDLSSVTVCLPNNRPLRISPHSEEVICAEASHVVGAFQSLAKLKFDFALIGTILRSIRIKHQQFVGIGKNHFTAPAELTEAVFMNDEVPETWNTFIPSIEADYSSHFHNLLYLEEVSVQKQFKQIYTQNEAFFGDTNYYKHSGQNCQQKYKTRIFDLTVEDLFDTKPSLQPGDQVIARKHCDPMTKYEGVIIGTKEVDLIVIRFKDDFVATFQHTAYYVEFIPSRLSFVRQHYALDWAVDHFGMDYLMPTEIQLRQECLFDVRINPNNSLLTGKYDEIYKWFNNHLNEYQMEAVKNAIRGDSKHPYIIIGPPGTGKTTTLVEIILQILFKFKSSKILISAQSNSVADLMTERLIQSGQIEKSNVLRLFSYIYSKRMDDVPEDIQSVCYTLNDLQGSDAEMSVSKKLKVLEQISNYQVVIGTPSMFAQLLEVKTLRKHFTHAIIDEAGRCTEIDVLIPMLLAGKEGQIIMAGDPMQMPPFVSSRIAGDRGLDVSMLNRLIDCYTNIQIKSQAMILTKLYRNYRSLPTILDYYNSQYYNGELIAMIDSEDSYEAKLLHHLNDFLPGFDKSEYGIRFVNIKGYNEKDRRIRKNGMDKSWFNIAEVKVIKYLVEQLKSLGLAEPDLGVITPYFLQTRALKRKLESTPEVKVGTVEEFQGLERKVIVVSTVRTRSSTATIDMSRFAFITCPKRINVATSRARAMLIVVGQANVLSRDANWNVLIEGCKANNTYTDFDLKDLIN